MHDLVRLFAADYSDRHARTDSRATAFTLLLTCYLAATSAASAHLDRTITEPATWGFPTFDQALNWLDAEYPNLIAAVYAAETSRNYDAALNLPRALTYIMGMRARFSDDVALNEVALRAARRLRDRRGEAVMLRNMGGALVETGRTQEGIAALQDALGIYREIGDRGRVRCCLTSVSLS